MKYFYLLAFSISCFLGNTQVDKRDYSAWNVIVPKVKIDDKFSALSEFHRRSKDFYTNINQWVIRPRVDYKVSDKVTVGLGYSYLNFQNDAPKIDLDEHNVYQNFLFTSDIQVGKLLQQLRIEERFSGTQQLVGNTFQEGERDFNIRSRYRVTGVIPVTDVGDNGRLSLVAYEELMVNMSDRFRPDGIDQNWLFIGPKWKINEQLTLQTGYHDIYAKRGETTAGNSIWETALSVRLN